MNLALTKSVPKISPEELLKEAHDFVADTNQLNMSLG